MSECQCDVHEEQFEDQFEDNDGVSLVGKSFVEVRGGEILSAGYVNGKFEGKDLYVVSYVNIENDGFTLDEFQYEKLVPLEMFVMKDYRFYQSELSESWTADVNALIETKKKLIEERELARLAIQAKEKETETAEVI